MAGRTGDFRGVDSLFRGRRVRLAGGGCVKVVACPIPVCLPVTHRGGAQTQGLGVPVSCFRSDLHRPPIFRAAGEHTSPVAARR